MSLETDLRTHLLGSTGITAIVRGDRVFCGPPDQEDLQKPAITIYRLGAERSEALNTQSGWVWADIQVDSWARTYLDCEALNEAVRQRLENLTGTIGNTSTVVNAVLMGSDPYTYESEQSGDDVGMHHYAASYRVLHSASIAAPTT